MQIWILDLVSRSWTFSEIYCFYTQDELSNYFRLFVADPTNLDSRTALFVIEDLQLVLRMRIHWIRKILASCIRIRKNMRIQVSGSKRQNIKQKP